MIIYKDLITGDELFSDAYKLGTKEDDFIITVEAKMTTMKGDSVSADLIGGNPSAEDGGDEAVDDPTARTGLDLVLAQSLEDQSACFPSKKSLLSYLKKYVKNLAEQFKQDGDAAKEEKFKKDCSSKLRAYLDAFDPEEDTIYCGPHFDPSEAKSCPMIGKWNPDGMGLTFHMLKDALMEEKQ